MHRISDRQLRHLNGAAGHLCEALEALRASGCEAFAGQLCELLDSIDHEIDRLRARWIDVTSPRP